MSHYKTEADTRCKLIRLEAPGVEKLKVKAQLSASIAGHWAVEISGNKKEHDSIKVLKESEELSKNKRLLPAQSPDAFVTSSDICRYGKFQEMFQVELNFKKPRVTKSIGPINGIFYLLFEEEEEDPRQDSSSDEEQGQDDK